GFMHGLSTRWVRHGFLSADGDYTTLDRLAAEVPPGAGDVQYLCSNVMNARRWRHGAPTIIGFDILRPTETGLGALFRAVMAVAAYATAFAKRRALYEHMLAAADRSLMPFLWQGAGASALDSGRA